MTRIDSLLAEFASETETARTHLERLPAGQFEWRPQTKSFTAGRLASHMVDRIRWSSRSSALTSSTWIRVATNPLAPPRPTRAPPNLGAHDPRKGAVREAREPVFRDMTFSHLGHHRGQFSVYLRLLEVPVPGLYSPTADGRR